MKKRISYFKNTNFQVQIYMNIAILSLQLLKIDIMKDTLFSIKCQNVVQVSSVLNSTEIREEITLCDVAQFQRGICFFFQLSDLCPCSTKRLRPDPVWDP